jgi:uncharacterized protein DUF6714
MAKLTPDCSAIEAQIHRAFAGVTLDRGMSLRQAQVADRYCEGVSDAEYRALPKGEITNDWSQVPLGELDRNCVAHLDPQGFRYYLPALMLSVLNHYDPASMRVIGTIQALYPKLPLTEYDARRYSVLSDDQRTAIANFLNALPQLVSLDADDTKRVNRAVRNYWAPYLGIERHGT